MDNLRIVDISVYEGEREMWGWPIPDQKRAGINEHQSKSVSSKAEDYDELLAEAEDVAERQIWEFDEPGDALGKGRDIEWYCQNAEEESAEENEKWWVEYRKTPEQKAEEQRVKTLEQNRRRYIGTGCEDNYIPNDEDRMQRAAKLESDRNPQFIPF